PAVARWRSWSLLGRMVAARLHLAQAFVRQRRFVTSRIIRPGVNHSRGHVRVDRGATPSISTTADAFAATEWIRFSQMVDAALDVGEFPGADVSDGCEFPGNDLSVRSSVLCLDLPRNHSAHAGHGGRHLRWP